MLALSIIDNFSVTHECVNKSIFTFKMDCFVVAVIAIGAAGGWAFSRKRKK
ncbi:hypothetical protein KJ652_07285 [Patescibacteria group bacterium]|nr:hypothetical protein [Patescibacteria group bacterium]